MIEQSSDPKLDGLVNYIVSDESLMSLDPIMAGGSMLSVYRAYKLHDTPYKWEELKRSLASSNSFNRERRTRLDFFGDIDIWFKESSEIHAGTNRLCWLINNYTDKASFPDTHFDAPLPRIERETLNSTNRLVKSTTVSYTHLTLPTKA